MALCRISRLDIQGFRAFGRSAQALEFPSLLAAVLGSNSQGKTSLAEAIEFLLTGEIVRRSLMASGQDEFADALRNAHLPYGTEVVVRATVIAPDGKPRTIKRVLKTDYGKKQNCTSVLEIDGKAAAETDLAAIGIVLSQPPLRAPVLAQHTLGYLFSARPQDRASYFKALLEVIDLDEFRAAVAQLEPDVAPPTSPLIGKLQTVAVSNLGKHLNPLLTKAPGLADIEAAVSASCKELIEAHGESVPADCAARLEKVETILSESRAKTFPLKGFDRKPAAPWSQPGTDQLKILSKYIDERAKVDAEARRVVNLFKEALKLPPVASAEQAIDCPLCESEKALTPERIKFIRDRVADTESLHAAWKDARDTLGAMVADLNALDRVVADAVPFFISNPSKFRRERGFRVERVRGLLGDAGTAGIDAWLKALRKLGRARTLAVKTIRGNANLLAHFIEEPEQLIGTTTMRQGFTNIAETYRAFTGELEQYAPLEKAVGDALKIVVDEQSQTTGWQELVDFGRDQENLRAALIDRFAHAQVAKELAAALKQIDKGNEEVLDEKFEDLSEGVGHWWNLLRPDELSFFAGVVPRPGARRTIDFKAGLATLTDRSDAKSRDVVAVFSQSQLHCLGLSLFLARSVKEHAGFIVLDDPILSSDEDYRAFFNSQVIEDLLKRGIQVILLTQDQRTWKDLGERYLHQNVSQFQIVLQSAADGSMIANTADNLETAFIRAETLVRGGHPSLHKQAGEVIRDSAERFCKEVLVRDSRRKGMNNAALTDHDGKTLGQLSPSVEPLLTVDPSHPGKLRTIGAATNPAKHDDAVPAAGTLKVALGDLRALKREYLR